MPLDYPVLLSAATLNRPLRGMLLASALFSALVLGPWEARADDACSLKCAQRQARCSTSCARGDQCRQHCNDSADTCFARCQKTDDVRETAQQRGAEKPCVGDDGRMRKCTAAEAQQIREGMEKASKLMCRGKNGEQTVCSEQSKQLEDARKFVPKNCTETGCKADTSN